jgi:outer membrane protein TolC
MSRLASLLLCLAFPLAAFAAPAPAKPRVLELTLDTAIQKALAKNFSIQVQRFDPQIAKQGVRQQLGRFDPDFNIRAERSENTQREIFAAGVLLSTTDITTVDRLTSGLSGITPLGTEYDLSYRTFRTTGTANSFAEDYQSAITLGLTQPLLRDAGPAVNLAQVRIARNNVRVSEWQLRRRIIDIITTTTFVYNELQLSIENRAVAIRSRDLAQQLARDNQERVNVGTMIPLDVIEASAQVAAREEGVILAERNVLDNENLLKQLVTDDILALLGIRVEIATPPSPMFRADVLAGIREALDLRPDYRQAILELEQRNIRLVVSKNQTLPRIDLAGSLSLIGFENDFGSSLSRVAARDQTAWTAGVIFSIPLGNREAKASAESARLEVAKQLVSLQELEQQVVVDVDNASGQILTSRQRIASTREAARLARQSLAAGEERLRFGAFKTFDVLDLQEKLASAEAAEVRARSDYNKAVSEYYRQTGTTLRVYNVVVE